MPRESRINIYIPAENRPDVQWARKEFPQKSFNKILLDLLHDARMKAETAETPETPETAELETSTGDNRTEAETYYRRKFGFLKTDYKDDRDILATLGESRTLSMLDSMFKQVVRERPEHYTLCAEYFRKEHPGLSKIRNQ